MLEIVSYWAFGIAQESLAGKAARLDFAGAFLEEVPADSQSENDQGGYRPKTELVSWSVQERTLPERSGCRGVTALEFVQPTTDRHRGGS